MHEPGERQMIAINVYTARIIPIILSCVVAYATYVLVALLSVNYLLVKHNDKSAAIPILIIYFILLLFMASSFFRLLYITIFDPPYVELGPAAIRRNKKPKERKPGTKSEEDGIGGGAYPLEDHAITGSENDPDSPGLELFYTKDVFMAAMDGKPTWCHYCLNWKPDRTHHCSSSGRCIRKMDHFCPWVGGPVGESNYKFFVQFNGYTALYCIHLLVVMAIYISRQQRTEGESINRHFAAILGLAGFFGLFTFGMFTSALDLAAKNLTQVENLGLKSKSYVLAVIKPASTTISRSSPINDNGYSYLEITYPLSMGKATESEQLSCTRRLQEAGGEPDEATAEISSRWGGTAQQSAIPIVTENSNTTVVNQSFSNGHPRENFTKRDLGAVRRFAVLRMNTGENPFDLGSIRLNLQTVFGSSISDIFLPIRRSPCCNHDNSESQFEVGPWVDVLRANFGLMAQENVRPLPKRKMNAGSRVHKIPQKARGSFGKNESHVNDIVGNTKQGEADSNFPPAS